jgi:acyl-CoA thioester hydrolase
MNKRMNASDAPPPLPHFGVHTTTVRVRYGDTDQMQVVYYANYLRFFEAARIEWLRAHGLPYKEIEAAGALFPVIEAHLRYRLPARFDDELGIECWPSHVRSASLRFQYRVVRGDELLCDGFTAHACIDTSGRPRRFPDSIRARILAGSTEKND